MRTRLGLVLTTVVLTFVGCSRCSKPTAKATAQIERMLPRNAVAVLVIPNLTRLGEGLKSLQSLKVAGFAAQLNGFTDAHQWADALVQQLGIDVRSKASLENAGLNASGPAALVMMSDGTALMVLPVKNEATLAGELVKLSMARLGAGVAEKQQQGSFTVHTFATTKGSAPRLGYVMVNGLALIGSDRSVGKLSVWANLPEVDSLSKDAAYAAALGRLPKDGELVLHLPTGSPMLRGPFSSATAIVSLRPDAVTIAADATSTSPPQSLEVLVKKSGSDLFGYLPADAWLVAKFSGDPTQLAGWVNQLAPQLKRAFDEASFDLNAEVLGNLVPGAVAGLSLAPTMKMGGMPKLDLRSTNPFAYVHLTGATEVKDPAKVVGTLDKLSLLAPRIGAQMSKADRQGQSVYFTTYSAGEGVHLAAKDSHVFFGSPADRIDALLKSDGKTTGSRTSFNQALDSGALTVAIDLKKLANAVRELPSAAWGLGGFAIKATTLRWLDATDDLEAITAGFESKGGAVQARWVLSFTPPPSKPKVP